MFNVKKNLVVLIAALVLILGLITYFVVSNSKNSNNSSVTSSSSSSSQVSQSSSQMLSQSTQMSQSLDITKVVGSYTGTGTILTSSLVFPNTVFTLGSDSKFVLDAKGLDLALLNDEALKVQDQFPVAGVKISGLVMPKADGSADMKVTSINPVFTVGGQALPESSTPKIMEGLKKYGIELPVASETQPLIVGTKIEVQNSKLVINNLPDSKFVVNFIGNSSALSNSLSISK